MRSPNRVCARVQKIDLYSFPSGSWGGRMQYAPTIGYVRSFEIPMQFSNWVRARVQKMDLYTPPTVAYGGAYAIRPYDRVCAILQNTDAIPQSGTCEGSKNGSVYATVGGVWWGVFDTPLRPGTCDPSKYRCDPPTGYVRHFKKLSRFRPLRGRLWGVCDTPLQPATCDPSKY